MLVRRLFSAVALLALAAAGYLGAQQRVLVLPGAGSSSDFGAIYQVRPFHKLSAVMAPGGFLGFSNPAGASYFLVSNLEGDASVAAIASNGLALQDPVPLSGEAVAARLSPDGSRLLVLTDRLHVLDVTGDTADLIATVNVGGASVDVDMSLDSSRAFVLNPVSQNLFVVDLASNLVAGSSATVPANATSVAVGPNGLVYVAARDQLLEIDGGTLALRATIPLQLGAQPGRPAFTADGQRLVVGNTSGFAPAAYVVNLVERTAVALNSSATTSLDTVVVADNNRFFGLASSTLYVGGFSPLSLTEAVFGGDTFEDVTSIAVSNEVPRAWDLFVAGEDYVRRVDLLANVAAGAGTDGGFVSFVVPAATGSVQSVLQYNQTQTAITGGDTAPLVVRAIGANDRPLSNLPVVWTGGGLTEIPTPMTATNAQGFAQARFAAPETAGAYTVTALVGTQTVSFTINAQAGSGPPPGNGGQPGGPASAVVILSGQGQTTPYARQPLEPFSVQVQAADGAPVPGATVTWEVTASQPGAVELFPDADTASQCTRESALRFICTADSTGISKITYFSALPPFPFSYSRFETTASSGTASAVLHANILKHSGTGPVAPLPTLLAPEVGTLITGRSGQTLPGAIRVQVTTQADPFSLLPFAGVTVYTPEGSGPTAACAGGTVLTGTNGVAVCDLVLGGIGAAPLFINVGGIVNVQLLAVEVEPGPPAQIAILAGNNQSGTAGQRLPVQLQAEIRDAGGNPLPGVTATFEAVTVGTVTLSPTTAVSNAFGRVATTATLGSTPGTHQVRVRAGNANATFNVTVSVSVTAITIAGGNNQTAAINTQFAQPLAVQVNGPQGALPNIPVNFTVLSGGATLSAASATTNAQGQAQVNLTAGPNVGPIQVRAAAGGQFVTFSLTARTPGPVLSPESFLNGASFEPGVAFGSIVTIQADGITAGLNIPAGWCISGGTSQGPLPTRLAGMEVQFAAHLAPIFAICHTQEGSEQVIVQAPFELAPAEISVSVRRGAETAAERFDVVNGVPILPALPGIFEYAPEGANIAVAVRPDGSYVSPANPARRGEVLRFFATGLGPVLPLAGTNQPGVPGQVPFFRPVVELGGAGMGGVTAEYAENSIGVFVITFQIPENAPTGQDVSLSLSMAEGEAQVYSGKASRIPIE